MEGKMNIIHSFNYSSTFIRRQLPPRSFVGLTRLKTLSIHTYNADWTSMSLEPDYESLIGLSLLEDLDLSHNNLASMPAGLLCPLVNIVQVSLTNLLSFENDPNYLVIKLYAVITG
jgi:hypothetical protein